MIKLLDNNKRIGNEFECIDMLRFPLAVLVVFIHSFGQDIDMAELHASGFSGMAVYDYIRILISAVIARSAVPLFFLFSGFLLFRGGYSKKIYFDKLGKRLHSLVKPYLIWNLLMVLWALIHLASSVLLHGEAPSVFGDYFKDNGYIHMLWNCNVWEERTTWLGNETSKTGPILLTFWYMRDLFVMVAFSPLVYWLIKKLRIVYILLLLVVYLMDIRPSCMSGTICTASLFFSIGAYFAIMKIKYSQLLWRWRYIICPLTVVLIIAQTTTGAVLGDKISQMLHLWLVVIQCFAFIIIAHWLCRYDRIYKWNRKLAPVSFFIYASHVFVLSQMNTVVIKMTPMSDTWYMQILGYFLAPMICVGVCIAVYVMGRKWMPRAMNVLMGERIEK